MGYLGNRPKVTYEWGVENNLFKLPKVTLDDGVEVQIQPDKSQLECAKKLYEGDDVVFCAPTGTGKTAVAHYIMTKNLNEGKKTIYTTPLKALANDKLREFRKIYGEENEPAEKLVSSAISTAFSLLHEKAVHRFHAGGRYLYRSDCGDQ